MPKAYSPDEWLDVVEREYLSGFIPDGGATIKFVVSSEGLRRRLIEDATYRCERLGYLALEVDAATTRFHMPQDIFLNLSAQISWPSLARRMVLRLAEKNGFKTEGIDADSVEAVYEAVADANDVEIRTVLRDLMHGIEQAVGKNRDMLRDFREAMRHLCRAERVDDSHPIVGWLGGARVSSVRDFGIYTRIDRTTARYFIESTLIWIQQVGFSGTVLVLDNSRVTEVDRPKDGSQYYTKARAMDHYEVLREFVDDADRLVSTFMLVAAEEAFADDSGSRRSKGYGIYEALKTRLMLDIRDKTLANPVASLVRLS